VHYLKNILFKALSVSMSTPYVHRMRNTEILVSGAGIAGAALAYWLREAGFAVTVVERAPAPRPGGQTVDLRGAGREVITRMGLMDRARALSVDQNGLALVDAAGRIRARLPVDAFGGEGIVSEIEILRGDLGRLLYEASASGVEYLFDDTITALDEDDDGVTVMFERAARRRFGLVAGADGLHSVVRALAFGPEPGCVRPLGLYTAWFTATGDMDLDGWYLMYNAPGGLVASARPGRLPGEVKAGLSFRSRPLAGDRTSDFYFDSMGQVRLDRSSRGRVVLVGDAGHCPTPLTGLGTSLALVGAYVLAGELGAAGDHRVAFDRYDQIMRPYVTEAQKLPPGGVSGYAPSSAPAIRMRAASMRSMTRWPMRKLLAAQFAKADDITLPEYRGDAVNAG
jgi:2-polyprenyl-6-methoxyphenol hydroxylase-like FAD-dependent oxidoreductase